MGATGFGPVTRSVSATAGKRCAIGRSPRSPSTVEAVGNALLTFRETLAFDPSTLPLLRVLHASLLVSAFTCHCMRQPTCTHASPSTVASPLMVEATGVALGGHGCALAAVVPVAAAATSPSSGSRAAERIRPQRGGRLPASHRGEPMAQPSGRDRLAGLLGDVRAASHSATAPTTRWATGWTPPR